MPIKTMGQIAEHSLFKAALPLVCALLIGSISWMFMTVMDLDKNLHRIEQSEIPRINEIFPKQQPTFKELEKMITNLRIKYAEFASPGHPSNRPMVLRKFP